MGLKPYQNATYRVRITAVACRLHLAPERPVKIVTIEHFTGGRGIEVFYTADASLSVEQVLARDSYRWPVETARVGARKAKPGCANSVLAVSNAVRRSQACLGLSTKVRFDIVS